MFYLSKRTFGASRLIKAVYEDLDFPINGFRVQDVPNDVSIDETDIDDPNEGFVYADVQRQKYAGILANNPFSSHIIYEDMGGVSSPAFDPAVTGTRGGIGEGLYWLEPGTGLLQTGVIDVSGDGVFDEFIINLDTYTLARGPEGAVYYHAIEPDLLDISVSIDAGGSFYPVMHMTREPFIAPDNRVVLRLENPSSERIYIGGFAILY